MSLTIREEKILEAAIDKTTVPLEPVTRREMIFAKAAGSDVDLPPAQNKEEQILSQLAAEYAQGGGGGGYFDMQPFTVNITNTKDGSPIPLEDFELVGEMQIYPSQPNQITVNTVLDINNGTIEIAKVENQPTRLRLESFLEDSGMLMIDTFNTTYEGDITVDPDEPDWCIVSGPGTINAVWNPSE